MADWPSGKHTYRDAVLALPGLVGYWRLGEASGSVAAALGAAPDGAYTGGVTLGQDGAVSDRDKAALFNGSTGYVNIPQTNSDPVLNVGDVFTLCALIKPANLSTYQCIVSGNRSNTTQARAYLRVNQTTGLIELDRYALNGVVTSTVGVDASKFWHICCTKNGGTVKIYIDGVDRTGTVTNATMDASPGGNTPWTIGAARNEVPVLSDFFNGVIDEVAIWNRALTAAQVAALYKAK